MKDNTKVRLHLSKKLFESLTKEIIKEAKANDGYSVAVKQPKTPKQSKSQATSPEVQKTDAEAMMGEMEMNVAEKSEMNEMDFGATDWSAIAAGMAAIGLAPLAIDKMHKWWEKNHPKSFKAAQKVSGALDKAAGNTPGQGHGVDTSKTFGPRESELKEFVGTETPDSGMIAALATLLGVGVPLATGLVKHLRQAKTPEEKKKVLQQELPGTGGAKPDQSN